MAGREGFVRSPVLTHVTQPNKATTTPFLTILRDTNMAVVMSSERRMGYLYGCLDLVLEGKIRSSLGKCVTNFASSIWG